MAKIDPGVYVLSADYTLTERIPDRLAALQNAGLSPDMPAGTKITARPSLSAGRNGECSLYGEGNMGLWPEAWPWLVFLLEKVNARSK